MEWTDYLRETRKNAEQYLIKHWGTDIPAEQRAKTPLSLTTVADIMVEFSKADEVTGMASKSFTKDEQEAIENIHGTPWVHYCHLAGVPHKELSDYTPEQIDSTLRQLAILFIGVPKLIKELVINKKIK